MREIIGLYLADQPLAVLYQVNFFAWFMIAAFAVLLAERRLWVAALGYGVFFIVVGRDPSAPYWVTGTANAVMTVNCLWIWRPQDGVKGYFKRRTTHHRGIIGAGPRTSQQSLVTGGAVAETLALAVEATELVSAERISQSS